MRFGRRREADQAPDPDEPVERADEPGIADLPPVGPFDETQVDLDDHEGIDLGSLVVTPGHDMELQLQVDESTGDVGAALLVGQDGALELRAFAASRGGGAWDDLRPQIAAEVTRMGGTASEQDGSYGPELLCLVPIQTPEGQGATQTSRITGHEGSTWLLRATLIGPPAADGELAGPWDEAIRRTVVRRGREARAPGSALPLRLPPDARRME
ncbi:MAG: DUF3710 domain-containing protein [Marmoricola sp.]|nr:DUF3710 domain-containing protein [Marmoricola sp.]